MKENNNFLKLVKLKNDREMFSALIYLTLIFFETDNYEGIEYLAKDYYGQMVSKGRGFSNPDSKFSPSVVDFGELTGFMLEDIEKIKSGKITKDEVRKANLDYLKNYVFNTSKKIIKSILVDLNQLAIVAYLENCAQSLKAVRVFCF